MLFDVIINMQGTGDSNLQAKRNEYGFTNQVTIYICLN